MTATAGSTSPDSNLKTAFKVFFVRAETEDGENLDLIVSTLTRPGVVELWRAHYDLSSDSEPILVAALPGVTAPSEGVFDWESLVDNEETASPTFRTEVLRDRVPTFQEDFFTATRAVAAARSLAEGAGAHTVVDDRSELIRLANDRVIVRTYELGA